MKISIKNFKRIKSATVDLEKINIFIGSNNSGKSSFIQGIQFAVSACQTLEIKKASWSRVHTRTLSLDQNDFLYTPTKEIESLHHGSRLTVAKRPNGSNPVDQKQIVFEFEDKGLVNKVKIWKGNNGGISTSLECFSKKRKSPSKKVLKNHEERIFGNLFCDLKNTFCVYIPGLAGIPTQEKYEVPIAIRKSAIRGDSNNYLRNILLSIYQDDDGNKWNDFLKSIRFIYANESIDLIVDFYPDKSEFINVYVKFFEHQVPLDAVGTGMLQVIQIFAYIEYFSPKLILLDEPDAHLHPTKQRRLALEIQKRIILNNELKIVVSTHSRYILDELENDANIVHFKSGTVSSNIENSSILLDIGALDSEQLFADKKIKYIIATEDKVENIKDKKQYLKKFLMANGLNEDEFVIHSYESCTKAYFGTILEKFARKHIPNVKVILHIDRDQMTDDDRDIVKIKSDCKRDNILLFVTKFQEIECYFLQPNHVSHLTGLNIEDVTLKYYEFVEELKEETRNKLINFIQRKRSYLTHNDKGEFDIRVVNGLVDQWMDEYKDRLTPGKELMGKMKSYIQSEKIDPEKIFEISEFLKSDEFLEILNK